jgi:hypothetical protein
MMIDPPHQHQHRHTSTTKVTISLFFDNMSEDELRQEVREQDVRDSNLVDAITPDNVSPVDVLALWAAGRLRVDPNHITCSWEATSRTRPPFTTRTIMGTDTGN